MVKAPKVAFVVGLIIGATLMLGAWLGYTWTYEPVAERTYAISYSLSSHKPPSFTMPAKNYVANDRQVIPALITACGGRFLTFNGAITSAMEVAYFTVADGGADELGCISKRAPNLNMRLADAEVVKDRLTWESIAYFARPPRVEQRHGR